MRILQVNKFLYRRAGAEAYMLDLVELLRKHGHEVRIWGPEEPLNFDKREGLWRDLKKFGHMVWSREAADKFDRALDKFQPEIIHLHNIYHQLSPAILPVAFRHRVPVVMTVHDYHLINPNYSLFDHGAICERRGMRAVVQRCIKNSYVASLADVVEWKMHQWLRVYERYVDEFLAPTEFVKRKLVEGGMDSAKIEVVPLPVSSQSSVHSSQSDNYILYAGRLTEEKGIYLVLGIAKHLPDIQFKIAGSGPEESNIKYQISNIKNVELLGFLEKEKLQKLMAGARMIIVPSLWQELSPYAVLEAMAAGKVVVASKIGGIPALVEHGKTGFLVGAHYESRTNLRISNSQIRKFGFHSQFAPEWVDTIQKVWHDKALLTRVGVAAREYVKRVHGQEKHYEKLMEMYRKFT